MGALPSLVWNALWHVKLFLEIHNSLLKIWNQRRKCTSAISAFTNGRRQLAAKNGHRVVYKKTSSTLIFWHSLPKIINMYLKTPKATSVSRGDFWQKSNTTLTYQIVVAHQIRVALGTFSEINNSSPSNNHSLGKNF